MLGFRPLATSTSLGASSRHIRRRKHNLRHLVTRLPSQGKLPTRRPHTTLHSGAYRVEEEPKQRTLVQPGTRPASVARRKGTSSLCARLESPRIRLADYKYVHCRLTPTPSCTVDTKLSMAEAPTPLTWIADTGSVVDAISLVHLEKLGSKRED